MDQVRRWKPDAGGIDASGPAVDERPPLIDADERRMHVRAHNLWISLLGDRAYPVIAELDPRTVEFGSNAVLLDFTAGGDPAIAYVGERLRDECGLGSAVPPSIAQVPAGSLLSLLTDR